MKTKTVRTFGVIGDGTTNDTTAVKSAFTAAANSGIVVFPAGRYRLTAPIVVTFAPGKSVTVQGEGQDISFLHFPAGIGGQERDPLSDMSEDVAGKSGHVKDMRH